MKRNLISANAAELFYYEDSNKILGPHPSLTGDCSRLRGDCSELIGNCSELSGYCSGLSGYCSGLCGDLDNCEITEEDRKAGVDIQSLINKGE